MEQVQELEFWKHVSGLSPGWQESRDKVAALLLSASDALKGGEHLARSLELLREAVAAAPDSAAGRNKLITTLIENGCFEQAFTAWNEIFRARPEWMEVHSAVQNHFYYYGQISYSRRILQCVVDHQQKRAAELQFDRLGIRGLREYPSAIGHIGLLDNYAKMTRLGWRSSDEPVLLVHPRIANPAYLEYWRDFYPRMVMDPIAIDLMRPISRYIEDRITPILDKDRNLTAGEDYVGAALQAMIQSAWEAEGRGPLLKLKDQDRERGSKLLQSLGMPADAWFVSLHIREGRCGFRAARDASAQNYFPAIDEIRRRGGWVVRMGDPSMTPLPPMDGVIDYAVSKARQDWMDIYLWAACRFYIGTPSGPAWIPPTFGVPCVATNWNAYLTWRWFGQDIFLPKLLWLNSEKRYLKFTEVLGTPLGSAEAPAYFESVGVTIVDNTAEEITESVVEMLDRLEGKSKYCTEDEERNKRFETAWSTKAYKGAARIGREFLKRHADLI
ncbi:MAG: TIGR04372 family glycosyltransferase [Oligoflexia bacterium]|nr:TIGR04372 family glycosyltransferase [Oligoflexia bacterium]